VFYKDCCGSSIFRAFVRSSQEVRQKIEGTPRPLEGVEAVAEAVRV